MREAKTDERGQTMPYLLLGPVRYIRHEGSRPMNITHPTAMSLIRDFMRLGILEETTGY